MAVSRTSIKLDINYSFDKVIFLLLFIYSFSFTDIYIILPMSSKGPDIKMFLAFFLKKKLQILYKAPLVYHNSDY